MRTWTTSGGLSAHAPGGGPTLLSAHLVAALEWDHCLALQQRLVYEAGGSIERTAWLVLCEHPTSITVGRQGSWAHLRHSPAELASRQVPVHWLNRGGGCLVHGPGQLAVYLVVPLERFGLSVGQYLRRLSQALTEALIEMKVVPQPRPGCCGVWGRTGQLAAVGVAVKNWTTYFGAYVNVSPAMGLFHAVQTDPDDPRPMGSLVAEVGRHVRMTAVREALVRNLARQLRVERSMVTTGHPLLAAAHPPAPRTALRVG